MSKQQKEQYLSSLDEIRQVNDLTSDNIFNIAYAKIIPKYLDKNTFLSNSYPISPQEGYISRTSLAHKAMFDFCDGTKDIKVFAKGLHRNIYSVDFVINSFKAYISRFMKANKDDSVIPLTLISKEKN